MTIYWLDTVDSTQRHLKDALKRGTLQAPVAVAAHKQTEGTGSRGNRWEGVDGNLFFSFALKRDTLPNDLKLESASIYLTYILKEVLNEAGSELWLKWPNDFYMEDKKIGGAITNLQGDTLICGIGLNTKAAPEGYGTLDIEISHKKLLEVYFKKLKKNVSWKQIFSKYELEFERSKSSETTLHLQKISLKNATLLNDGSIEWNGQRIFSLR